MRRVVALLALLLASADAKLPKGCGVEFEIESLCEMALGAYFGAAEGAERDAGVRCCVHRCRRVRRDAGASRVPRT